jgi:hypothetical protein
MVKLTRTILIYIVLAAFFGLSVQMPVFAQIDPIPRMPKPGAMVHLSPAYTPAYLKGIVIHPENALKFDFIIYKGDKPLSDAQKREEYTKLTKYFLASLAIPDDDQWVNLSPYEKDRIIKDDFGKTEMGRDLLAQDYLLKQITASLIYPQDSLGKKFWDKIYAEAQKQYGTTNISVNTFNKVWILPDDALIYEKGNIAYVLKNHLKVMLEEDYLSLQKHSGTTNVIPVKAGIQNSTHSIASKIIKQIILPELQREVNEDANFAPLRQVYSGMLLATWFKRTLKQSLLGQIYANKAKTKGVDQDPKTNEEIYQQYLEAYKKGVFNFIKEDTDRLTNETLPKKYFSGGEEGYDRATIAELGYDPIHTIPILTGNQAMSVKNEMNNYEDLAQIGLNEDRAMKAKNVEMVTDDRPLTWDELMQGRNAEDQDILGILASDAYFGQQAVIEAEWVNRSGASTFQSMLEAFEDRELTPLLSQVFLSFPKLKQILTYLFIYSPLVFSDVLLILKNNPSLINYIDPSTGLFDFSRWKMSHKIVVPDFVISAVIEPRVNATLSVIRLLKNLGINAENIKVSNANPDAHAIIQQRLPGHQIVRNFSLDSKSVEINFYDFPFIHRVSVASSIEL